MGLNRRRTEGEADGLGRFARLKGGLGELSCFLLQSGEDEEFARIENPLGPGRSTSSHRPPQLGNRCLALRTSSSISCVQLVLPDGEALVAVLNFLGVSQGDSWERLGCLGAAVGLALSEETLELRPLRVRGWVFAASVTGCRAEEEEFCEQVSRFPGFEEKGLSAASSAPGVDAEVTMAGLLLPLQVF